MRHYLKISVGLSIMITVFSLAWPGASTARWDQVVDPITIAKAAADKELFGRVIEGDGERPAINVHHNLLWEDGTLMAGVFALYERTEQLGAPVPRYLDYIQAYAARNPGKYLAPLVHGDQVCVGQTYIWLYERSGKTSQHLELTDGMVDFLTHYNFKPMQLNTKYHTYWMRFWQDDIHMVPPFLAMRGRAAGNRSVPSGKDAREVAMDYIRAYHDVLGDKCNGLYWHNRKAIGDYYWGRGNGWVAAGHLKVMRILEEDPAYADDVAWLKERLTQMAATLKESRNNVGTWNASIENREEFTMPETSGSAFFTFMMANMLNNNDLPETYRPVVQKAWNFLRMSVADDGTMMRVQPVGRGPILKDFELNTATYGVGGFLLSAVEMSRMDEGVLRDSLGVECIKVNIAGAQISIETLKAKRSDFPDDPTGKVQAVIPGERLLPTSVNTSAGKIVIDNLKASNSEIYIFYKP